MKRFLLVEIHVRDKCSPVFVQILRSWSRILYARGDKYPTHFSKEVQMVRLAGSILLSTALLCIILRNVFRKICTTRYSGEVYICVNKVGWKHIHPGWPGSPPRALSGSRAETRAIPRLLSSYIPPTSSSADLHRDVDWHTVLVRGVVSAYMALTSTGIGQRRALDGGSSRDGRRCDKRTASYLSWTRDDNITATNTSR